MLFLVNQAMVDLGIGEAGLIALVGYAVVFFGLILLQLVVMGLGKIMVASQAKKKAAAKTAATQEAAAAAAAAPGAPAPGSAGEIKLHDVNEKDAAMIMAIVADKLKKPLNELRFKSIREVK